MVLHFSHYIHVQEFIMFISAHQIRLHDMWMYVKQNMIRLELVPLQDGEPHCFIVSLYICEYFKWVRHVKKSFLWLSFKWMILHAQNEMILDNMDRVEGIWYLSPMRAAKVQASLRIRAVSPEPPLLAHTSSESRGTFR